MTTNANDTLISQAWRAQKDGKASAAVSEFEKILAQEPSNIDAHYGIGLALRDSNQREKAVEHFKRALELVTDADAPRRAAQDEERLAVNTPQDDRYMMLTRMLKQRLAELGS